MHLYGGDTMEIARKFFHSLIADKWGYIVLNDGNFYARIYAKNDAEAIEKFERGEY
jgi:hypothetical protein